MADHRAEDGEVGAALDQRRHQRPLLVGPVRLGQRRDPRFVQTHGCLPVAGRAWHGARHRAAIIVAFPDCSATLARMDDTLLQSAWLWIVVGYLLGSIPFGLLLSFAGGAGDIRKIGSGNIGTTNVLRTGRKGLAAATLVLDAGKGAAAVLLARHFAPGTSLEAVAGIAAFLGHLYPAWLRFRGGKGVATMLGVTLAAYWPAGLVFAVVWIAAMLLTRYSSVGGMAAAVAAPILPLVQEDFGRAAMFWGMALFVLVKHRENIARLRAGTESKIGAKAGG
jgi:glycerol-3-phosphate acyltransferase PlsY